MAAVLRGERWFSPLLLDDLVREVRVLASGVAGVVTDRLSPREREVVRLAANGLGYSAIAHALEIAPRTVRSHVRNIAHKFAATSGRDLLDVVGAIGKEMATDDEAGSGPGDAEAPPRQEAGRPSPPEPEA